MSITITIDGNDKTNLVIFSSLKIRNRINNRIDECSFQIKKQTSQTYRPALGEEIVIEKDSTKLFGGVIVKIEESAKAGGQIILDIRCTDYSQFLRRKTVTERYENETLVDIIDDLVTNYTDDGFTSTNILVNKTITSISFNGLTVSECLDKLAKALNAYWYVDYDKDIHFFRKTDEQAPFGLTDTSGNYIYESLEIVEDITKLRNKVTVRGGVNPSDTDRTEIKVCKDADEDVYPLGYKFAEKPEVIVDGIAQTVGVEYLDDDGTADVMWSYQQKYIRFTTGNLPSVNDVIEVTGKIEIPVIVRTPDNASIAQFGIWEFQIKDDTIKTNDEAIERAVAELQTYANELNEGSFSTYNSGLHSGQVLNISSTLRDKNIDVVIQDVTLSVIDPDAEQIKYDISFATLKTIGIIEFLQDSLIDEDIIEDAQETLLNYIQQATENISISDEGVTIEITEAPYYWSDDDETTSNAGRWNFSTWEA